MKSEPQGRAMEALVVKRGFFVSANSFVSRLFSTRAEAECKDMLVEKRKRQL